MPRLVPLSKLHHSRWNGSTKLGKDKPFVLLPDGEGAWNEKGSVLLQPRLDGGEEMVLGASGQTTARSPDDDGEDERLAFLKSLACIVSVGDTVFSLATDAVHGSAADKSDASASQHLPVQSGVRLRISQAELGEFACSVSCLSLSSLCTIVSCSCVISLYPPLSLRDFQTLPSCASCQEGGMKVLDYREGSEEVAVVSLRRRVWRSW